MNCYNGQTQLSETAISGLRSTKDYVKFCDPAGMLPEKIFINTNLLSSTRNAYNLFAYQDRKGETAGGGTNKKKTDEEITDEKLKAERLLNAKKMAP